MNVRAIVGPTLLLLLLRCGTPAPPESPASAPAATSLKSSGPSLADVRAALASGDTEKARALADRLGATDGDTSEVRDAHDAVALADALKLTGLARLDALDALAAHDGAAAREAARSAKAERLRRVQELIDAQKPLEAVAAIDRWFGEAPKSDPEISEMRARAHDAASLLCGDPTCRYQEAFRANAWANTSGRVEKLAEAKAAVIAAFTFQEAPHESALERLRRLRTFIDAAAKTREALAGDSELQPKAATAKSWAEAERAKVPILGSDQPTAEELLGPLSEQNPRVASLSLGTIVAYLGFDARRKCSGIYIVGPDAASRAMNLGDVVLRNLVSQAVGRSATIHESTSMTTTNSSWTEGAYPVVARWRSGALMELRIGDAAP